MKIGILQTGHVPDALMDVTGDYDRVFPRLFDGHGFDFETWAVVDGQMPHGPDAADGWLITGSRHGAYEDHPWIPPLEDLIRAINAQGRPMIGVCFGHQIIAQALGGTVEKFSGGWAVGRQTYDYGGRQVCVNAWHQDQVTALPPGARVTGSNGFVQNAFLAYGDTIWTCQPHPEFDKVFVDGLLTYRAPGVVPDDLIKTARDQLDAPTDRLDIASEMAAFFKKERM